MYRTNQLLSRNFVRTREAPGRLPRRRWLEFPPSEGVGAITLPADLETAVLGRQRVVYTWFLSEL
jgi:hypothetical protein